MKEKFVMLFIPAMQVVLGVIMIILAMTWIVAHLYLGSFNLIGFIVAAVIWGIIFNLTKLSIREYKQERDSLNK